MKPVKWRVEGYEYEKPLLLTKRLVRAIELRAHPVLIMREAVKLLTAISKLDSDRLKREKDERGKQAQPTEVVP